MSVVRVVADVHEQRSGVIDALTELGVAVTVEACPVGDYVVTGELLVERKYVIDLHLSVIQGRLWPQVLGLRRGRGRPYLLVEGPDLDAGPLTPAAVRGALLSVVDAGVPLLRAHDSAESALWIHRLASRASEGYEPGRHRINTRRKRRSPQASAELLLAAVPGVSIATAQALLARFETVARVVAAPVEELMTVPGVGAKRAHAVKLTLHAPRRCSS